MTDVLILGGTGWLSGCIAAAWRAEGASVTALARGGRPAPEGVELVIGDREKPDAYRTVSQRRWDEVVDISSDARHVAAAVVALADRAAHWTYVSTVSTYASNEDPGADESAELLPPAAPDDPGPGEEGWDYGRAKVSAEASVRLALGERAAIVRPGLIVGPGDPTDRFGYWVARFAEAGAEPVLVPAVDGRDVQVIDVADLADFVRTVGSSRWHGTANAVGTSTPFTELIRRARVAAGHTGSVVEATDAWLEEHEVAHWAGPRSLPLWLPAGAVGFMTRANGRYLAAGGRLRGLDDTLARTLADERGRGLGRERRTGLTRDEERELLSQLGE